MRPAVCRARGSGVVGQRPGHPAMSHARGNRTVRVHGQKERRPGHTVRVHRPAAHIQNDGCAQGQALSGHILPEAPAQQSAQAPGFRVLRHGHPAPNHTQQYAGRGRGIIAQFYRWVTLRFLWIAGEQYQVNIFFKSLKSN